MGEVSVVSVLHPAGARNEQKSAECLVTDTISESVAQSGEKNAPYRRHGAERQDFSLGFGRRKTRKVRGAISSAISLAERSGNSESHCVTRERKPPAKN